MEQKAGLHNFWLIFKRQQADVFFFKGVELFTKKSCEKVLLLGAVAPDGSRN